MHVTEIFRSIQGEGALVGVPTTFVRFFACNLRCSWCDTRYTWSVRQGGTWEDLSADQMLTRVKALAARHVVLTGGEPVLEPELGALARALRGDGRHVTVETNATIFPDFAVPHADLWSLSPKLPSAGQGYLRRDAIARFLRGVPAERQQWKFVVRDDADEDCLRDLLSEFPAFRTSRLPITLQPEGATASASYIETLERLIRRVHDPFWAPYYVRVLPQLHVLVWGGRRRV